MSWLDYWIGLSSELVQDYGYLGVFLVQLVSSSSLFLPVPGFFVTIAAGAAMNPLLVTVSAAVGSSIGEFTGRLVAIGSRKMLARGMDFERARMLYSHYGNWSVFLFAATPLPLDLIGILSGIVKLNPAVFFAMTKSGKLLLNGMLVYDGQQSLAVLEDPLSGRINVFGVVFLLLMVLFILVPLFFWRRASRSQKDITVE